MLNYQTAQPQDVASLRNWTENTACIARDEVAFLGADEDLICVDAQTDSFLVRLELLLESALVWGLGCVGRVSTSSPLITTYPGIVTYDTWHGFTEDSVSNVSASSLSCFPRSQRVHVLRNLLQATHTCHRSLGGGASSPGASCHNQCAGEHVIEAGPDHCGVGDGHYADGCINEGEDGRIVHGWGDVSLFSLARRSLDIMGG